MRKYVKKSGYTLVDTLVSLAVFSIVILVCTGVLVTIVNANRKERSLKQAMDNLNVVIENISRTIKTGSKYYCNDMIAPSYIHITPCTDKNNCNKNNGNRETQNCPIEGPIFGGNNLALRDKYGNVVLYGLITDPNNSNKPCIGKKITNTAWSSGYHDDGNDYSCFTDSNVVIDNFKFYVYNTDYYDPTDVDTQNQPRVIFVVQGHTGESLNTTTHFDIMTSASQRLLHSTE